MSFIARARKKLNKSSPKKKTISLDFDDGDEELFNNYLHKVRHCSVYLIFTLTNSHTTILLILILIMHKYKVSVRLEKEINPLIIGKCKFIDFR